MCLLYNTLKHTWKSGEVLIAGWETAYFAQEDTLMSPPGYQSKGLRPGAAELFHPSASLPNLEI